MKPRSSHGFRFATCALIALALLSPEQIFSQTAEQEAADLEARLEWPREIETPEGKVVLYQPQIESFEGDNLSMRAALSVTVTGETAPVFGAVWTVARMLTDRETRTVELVDLDVTAIKFPDVEQADLDRISLLLETEIPKWDIVLSLDRLLAGLELVEQERAVSENLNTDPPKIIFVTTPTVLVLIDGEPQLKKIENTDLEYVVNTPFILVYSPSRKTYYLKGGEWWFAAQKVAGPWDHIESPPASVAEVVAQATEGQEDEAAVAEPDSVPAEPPPIPQVVVSMEPAELIQTDGEPDFASVEETGLLYLSNSESDVIMDIESQRYYVLLAGRWYASTSLTDNQWTFLPSDQVPEDFAKIPAESDMGSVRASVAGTQEAQEAVLDNQIPQTAEVDRTATVTVEYDGDPEFQRIEDTDMSYAVNTSSSVLLIDKRYYCCHDAVWYVAEAPSGPWTVCVEVPSEVGSIPPSSPVYNVKYVHVYSYTPEVVYVGYTPGYAGSYVYGGCVVYGTGYAYSPWWGYYYYPRPVTYGFGVHWNPWTGWGFSYGFSTGWFNVRWGYGGWWGPCGYRHGYRHGYHHGYRHGYYAGSRAGYQAGRRDAGRHNVYRNQKHVRATGGRHGTPSTRPASRDMAARNRAATQPRATTRDRQTPQASQGRNNVYADRSGNVYRKSDSGWESRDRGGWSSTDRSTRSGQGSNRSTRDLNRQSDARQRGTQKTQNYQRSQSTSRSRSGASHSGSRSGSRSGGGGRRR
jgi:hypothetical protein